MFTQMKTKRKQPTAISLHILKYSSYKDIHVKERSDIW